MIAGTRQSGWVGHLLTAALLVCASAIVLTGSAQWAAGATAGPNTGPADRPLLHTKGASTRPASDDDPAVEVATQALLNKVLPDMMVDARIFRDAVDFLRDITGASIFVNWGALEAAGVAMDTPVNVRLRHAKFEKVLRTILADAGGGNARLDFEVENGVLTISTREDLDKNTITRIYDVRELLVGTDDVTAAAATRPAGTRPAGRDEAMKEIVRLLDDIITPDFRNEKVGAVREIDGRVVVTTAARNHRAIGQVLRQVREARAVQIRVGFRFIAAGETLAMKLVGDALRFGPAEAATTQPANASAMFLNGNEVKALLKGLQVDDPTGTLLRPGPRLIMFNGQRVCVPIATRIPYVAGYSVITEDGRTRYEPKVELVELGITLDVRATLSGDGKATTLMLSPKLTQLLEMEKRPYEGSPGDQKLTVDVPMVEESSIQTTVNVAHGDTLLLAWPTMERGKILLLLVRPEVVVDREP